jgi:hypothetical protein
MVLAILCSPTIAYSGEIDFPELFTYNDEMNANLETALHLISSSFNEMDVPIAQELLAAMMATLVKEVGSERHKFEPREEDWSEGIQYYEGGADYKGRGYIQLTGYSNYVAFAPDCVAFSPNVCGCENNDYCTVTDESLCPQAKALKPDRSAKIFASYYIGNSLVSLSNSENYLAVGNVINNENYALDFDTKAKNYLTLFRNNPDKTEKLLTWLNSVTSTSTPVAVDVLSLGIPPQEQNQEITLTLYVHEGDANGPTISRAQVTGQDGSGSSFQQTTNLNGYVSIAGDPGTWSFSASADGYEVNNWNQEITEADTKDAFLRKSEEQSDISNPPIATLGTWNRTYGRGAFYSVQQTSEGGYIAVGYTQGDSGEDMLLTRTDANGNELWSRTFGALILIGVVLCWLLAMVNLSWQAGPKKVIAKRFRIANMRHGLSRWMQMGINFGRELMKAELQTVNGA